MANGTSLTIHEEYTCDSDGKVRVKIEAEPDGFAREYAIGLSI